MDEAAQEARLEMTITPEETKRLRELETKATRDWFVNAHAVGEQFPDGTGTFEGYEDDDAITSGDDGEVVAEYFRTTADRDLAVAARNALPALLGEVEGSFASKARSTSIAHGHGT